MRADLLNVTQVAARLEVDRRTARKAMRSGQIPGAVQIGERWYVPAAALRELLGTPPVTPVEPRPSARFRRP